MTVSLVDADTGQYGSYKIVSGLFCNLWRVGRYGMVRVIGRAKRQRVDEAGAGGRFVIAGRSF